MQTKITILKTGNSKISESLLNREAVIYLVTHQSYSDHLKKTSVSNSSEVTWSFWTPLSLEFLPSVVGGVGGGNGYFLELHNSEKNVRCLLLLMIVDKFATHTYISRQNLGLIITTQFSRVYNRL